MFLGKVGVCLLLSRAIGLKAIKSLSHFIYVMGLHHTLDGVTNHEYKLLRFIQLTIFFAKEEDPSF